MPAKFNPRDSGPFSAKEAADRVKLASQHLKWFALQCEPIFQEPIAIFETEAGKQGLLMFKTARKAVKLLTLYGRNGWEQIHEELRRTNGKPAFSKTR